MLKKEKMSRMIGCIIKCELMALIPALLMAIHYAYEVVGWYEDWLRLLWEGKEHEFPSAYEYFHFFLGELENAISVLCVVAVGALVVGCIWANRKEKEN